MKSDDIMMKPLTDLMWTAEEENDLTKLDKAVNMQWNCGGGGCACCCCCSVPSIITKWLCNG